MSKPVRVAITFDRTVEVPDDYDEHMVEFWMNDSSHCLISELRDEVDEHDAREACTLCSRAIVKVLDMSPPGPDIEE